ncbi:hypothetical protein R3P38DRAFT_3235890 [Favolaschia claudopus]|uniref:F-box domain-containing protein n=1 Tax=Favolaschia claudopus TaxID=2862362 RepID=A0AAV9ZCU4_9AGAR
MMSVEGLWARIAKLDTEIKAQRELLKQLEREKSQTQYELNMVQDPISRLPFEISSQIFINTLNGFAQPGPARIPTLFLSVCSSWSSIALGTPDLWSSIHITFPCAGGFTEVLPIWLDRTRNRPLSIALEGIFEHDVTDIIWQRAQRLEHLEIRLVEDPEDYEWDYHHHDKVELWRRGVSPPGPFSSLKTFKMSDRHLSEDSDVLRVSPTHVVQLLRLALNLTECVFDVQRTRFDTVLEPEEQVVLPNLRRLIFGDTDSPHGDDEIFAYLSLPKLEVLSMSLQGLNIRSLLSTLTTQAPPLQELILGEAETIQINTLRKCFRDAPKLKRFEAWVTAKTVTPLLVTLLKRPSLLRRLATLVIHCRSISDVSLYEPLWTAILELTTARRKKFKVFRVNLRGRGPPHENLPDENTMAALRILADAGMRIHITGVVEDVL